MGNHWSRAHCARVLQWTSLFDDGPRHGGGQPRQKQGGTIRRDIFHSNGARFLRSPTSGHFRRCRLYSDDPSRSPRVGRKSSPGGQAYIGRETDGHQRASSSGHDCSGQRKRCLFDGSVYVSLPPANGQTNEPHSGRRHWRGKSRAFGFWLSRRLQSFFPRL